MESGKCPGCLFQIQGNGDDDRFMSQCSEAIRDGIHLYEHILLVPAGTLCHFSVEDGDFHDAVRMRFRAERMIPAISSL
jgi:hypothetical protein